jgi:hypothetical protein
MRMIQAYKKLLYLLLICTLFPFQTVCSQRAIVSLGKRLLQQRLSGNKQHVCDSQEGEKSYNNSITRRHIAGATTLLLVVLGYYSQKRFAGGGEFADFSPPDLLTRYNRVFQSYVLLQAVIH